MAAARSSRWDFPVLFLPIITLIGLIVSNPAQSFLKQRWPRNFIDSASIHQCVLSSFRRRLQLALLLPQLVFELREKRERVVAQNLTPDTQRVVLAQVATIDFFREHFGDAPARGFRCAIDAFSVVAVSAPHDAA